MADEAEWTLTCPICGVKFTDGERSAAWKLQQHLEKKRDAAHSQARDGLAETEVIVPEVVAKETSPYDAPTAEVRPGSPAPESGPRKWWQRKPKGVPPPSGHPKERSPRRAGIGGGGRRLPAADFLGDAYGGVGQLVGRMTPYKATSRALLINAPIAGYALDDAVKGTIVDRVLVQPGVRIQTKYQQVSGLVEVPILVFLVEQEMMKPEPNQQKVEGLTFMLRSAWLRGLPAMEPAIKKLEQDEAKRAEIIKRLYPDLPEGFDPFDAFLGSLFAQPQPQPQPQPEEAMAS